MTRQVATVPENALLAEVVRLLAGHDISGMPVIRPERTIAAMHATKTLHPPGGATALIAVIGSEKVHSLGFLYVLFPVLTGAAIMLAVALVVNNIAGSRKYPEFWW